MDNYFRYQNNIIKRTKALSEINWKSNHAVCAFISKATNNNIELSINEVNMIGIYLGDRFEQYKKVTDLFNIKYPDVAPPSPETFLDDLYWSSSDSDDSPFCNPRPGEKA